MERSFQRIEGTASGGSAGLEPGYAYADADAVGARKSVGVEDRCGHRLP